MVINGPNLNRLGSREPAVYGTATLADLEVACRTLAAELGLILTFRQTNSEAECIDWIHEAADHFDAVIFNPAAFTHYSYALGDACALLEIPLIEVHLSNPARREEFRRVSVVAPYALGTVAGFGLDSYLLALRALAERLSATR